MNQGTLAFPGAANLVERLRKPRPTSGGPSELELEAAAQIESLLFQLGCRIERAAP